MSISIVVILVYFYTTEFFKWNRYEEYNNAGLDLGAILTMAGVALVKSVM